MPALDYRRVAELYDRYCVFDADLAFWRSLAAGSRGPVLELMAGTGRVSLPLIESGAGPVCLDSSPAMLAQLRRKAIERDLRTAIVTADARRLPFRRHFELVLLAFQGLSELVTSDDRLATLRSVAACLADTGRFVCTTHDPESRLRSIDGRWHDLGTFAGPDGGELGLSLRGEWNDAERTVHGEQRLRLRAPDGEREEIVVPLRFALPSLEELLELSAQAGLRCLETGGDYDGGRYLPGTSPILILALERRR